jgi:NADH-quinone oxidoreductase subunit E
MLTDVEKQQINDKIAQYPQKKAACIEAMKIVQDHRRWISDESLHDIAAYLEMTPEELDSIATFYNLIFRKPVGRHVILICDSISCWIVGYDKILETLTRALGIRFGETTPDERFTLLPIPCLGTCDHAPALMIDEDLHRDLTPEKIENILNNYE